MVRKIKAKLILQLRNQSLFRRAIESGHGMSRHSIQAVMSYNRFCRVYGDYAAVSGASSRVGHKAGRGIEADWSGPTMQLLDLTTDEISKVYLFVACVPLSRYEFVEATVNIRQESWLRAHAAMFAFFGGTVPRLVSDNVKTGVNSHPREGEVFLNDAYREMAAQHSAAVLPGRVRAPQDKASVENTVFHFATWERGLEERAVHVVGAVAGADL